MQKQGLLHRLYHNVPRKWKERAGIKLYERYLTVRRTLLDAGVAEHDGERHMSYLFCDRGHPETLVFLHGFADSKDNFYDAAHFLVDRYNIICPDLPGFGKSDKRKDDTYSLANYGSWVCDFIEGLGLDDFHLAGNSLGGAVAAEVARRIPDKVKTLTLIDPAGIYYKGKHSLHQELFDGNIIFDVRNRLEFEYFLDRVFYNRPLLPPPVKDFFYYEFHGHSLWHRKILDDLFQGLKSEDDPRLYEVALNNRLPEIRVPTLILWGDEDSLFPHETAYEVKKLIPSSRLHFFTDVGHSPQIEVPRRFARVLKKFLNEETARLEQERLHQQTTAPLSIITESKKSRRRKPQASGKSSAGKKNQKRQVSSPS